VHVHKLHGHWETKTKRNLIITIFDYITVLIIAETKKNLKETVAANNCSRQQATLENP